MPTGCSSPPTIRTFEDPRDIDIRLAHAAADGKAEIISEPDRTIAVERAPCGRPP